MVAIIGILGALQLLAGVAVYFLAASAVHEILAAVLFGFGTVALGIGMLMERADTLHKAHEELAYRLEASRRH